MTVEVKVKDSEQIREGLIKSVVSTLGDGGEGGVKTFYTLFV